MKKVQKPNIESTGTDKYGTCPICSQPLNCNGICVNCHYSESRNYGKYLTLGHVPEMAESVGCLKRKVQREQKMLEGLREIQELKSRFEDMSNQQIQMQMTMDSMNNQLQNTQEQLEKVRQELTREKTSSNSLKQQIGVLKHQIEEERNQISNLKKIIAANNKPVAILSGKSEIALEYREGQENDVSDATEKEAVKRLSNKLLENIHSQNKEKKSFITISFGHYTYGKNRIELVWQIIEATENGKYLLICKNIVEFTAFHAEKNPNITWGKSTLNKWLQGEFYQKAFSKEEKALICSTEHEYNKDGHHNYASGKSLDRIFILSLEEANKYFHNKSSERKCKPILPLASKYSGSWWLRTMGNNGRALYVNNGGAVDTEGMPVNHNTVGVRPALWIDLNC